MRLCLVASLSSVTVTVVLRAVPLLSVVRSRLYRYNANRALGLAAACTAYGFCRTFGQNSSLPPRLIPPVFPPTFESRRASAGANVAPPVEAPLEDEAAFILLQYLACQSLAFVGLW